MITQMKIGIHEAGHAVIGLHLLDDYREEMVVFQPGRERDGAHGWVKGEGLSYEHSDPRYPANYIVFLMAGFEAEIKFDSSSPDETRRGAGSDDEKIEEIAADFNLDVEPLRVETRRLVESHWAEIRSLAMFIDGQEIVDGKKELSGDVIGIFCDAFRSGKPKPFSDFAIASWPVLDDAERFFVGSGEIE